MSVRLKMNNKIKRLKELCQEDIKADEELTRKLLNHYKKPTSRGRFYNGFLEDNPNVEDKRNKTNKDLEDFGVDFNIEDGYLTPTSILHIIKLIEDKDE